MSAWISGRDPSLSYFADLLIKYQASPKSRPFANLFLVFLKIRMCRNMVGDWLYLCGHVGWNESVRREWKLNKVEKLFVMHVDEASIGLEW